LQAMHRVTSVQLTGKTIRYSLFNRSCQQE
jgi:hypothetical protein